MQKVFHQVFLNVTKSNYLNQEKHVAIVTKRNAMLILTVLGALLLLSQAAARLLLTQKVYHQVFLNVIKKSIQNSNHHLLQIAPIKKIKEIVILRVIVLGAMVTNV